MPRPSRRAWLALAAVAASLLASGCAARWAYRQGQGEARKGNWDLAVARLTRALQKDPGNIDYKIALETAKVQASRAHYDKGRRAMAADDLDKAAEEFSIAAKYDPGNKSAADDLTIVSERIRKRDDEKRRLSDYDAVKARAESARVPVPALSARSPVPIILKFNNTPLEKIFDTLSKLTGVNILLSGDYKDKNVSVNLANVTFEQALDELAFVHGLFYKVVDSNTLIIIPESVQNRAKYEDNVLRTFYLQNADVKETADLLTKLLPAGPTSVKVAQNVSLGAITVRGTPDELALAARVIEANDKPKGEVVVEVEILEVQRQKLKDYGIALSNYEIHESFQPGGKAPDSAGFTNFQAQILSSLNVSDFVVSIPSTLFAKFLQNESNVRLLSSPRLRAAEGEKTTLKVVTQIPIPTTTFQATNTGGATFTPITTTQYKDVGVLMDITPKVNPSGDISLKLSAEFSLLGTPVTINNTAFPSFLSRTVTGVLRVQDGQTSLIGGLVQGREATSLAGVLGLLDIPILNRIFSSTQKTKDETEILISLTPHLVRGPKITEDDLRALLVGTALLVKVPGARPPLFGAEEPPGPAPPAVPQDAAPKPPTTTGVSPEGPSAAPPPVPTPTPAAGPAPSPTPSPDESAPPPSALLRPAELTVKGGETGLVSLFFVGARSLTGVDVTVLYDPAALEVTDISPGSLLTLDGATVGAERTLERGRARAHFTRGTATSGAGAVAAIRFKASRPGAATLGVESLGYSTPSGNLTLVAPDPARVTVRP